MIRVPGENPLPPWGLWSWGQWSESHGDWHACPSHCSYYFPFNNSFGPVLISDINECFFTVNGHDLNAMVSSIKICIPSIAGIKHIAGTPSDQQLETILRIEIWLICSVLCIHRTEVYSLSVEVYSLSVEFAFTFEDTTHFYFPHYEIFQKPCQCT